MRWPKTELPGFLRINKRGNGLRFTVRLRQCSGHEGTTVHLERKMGDGSYKLRGKNILNEKCVAKFRESANYKRATYKGIWPKQDDDHRRGGSRGKSVTTG